MSKPRYDLEEKVVESLYQNFKAHRPDVIGKNWSWMAGWCYKASVEALRSGSDRFPVPEISGGMCLRFKHTERDSVFEIDFSEYPRLGFRVKGLSGSNKQETVREALVAWVTGAAI